MEKRKNVAKININNNNNLYINRKYSLFSNINIYNII
jgi:hypothetical protein